MIKTLFFSLFLLGSFISFAPALASTQDEMAKQLQAAGSSAGTTEVKDPRVIAIEIIRLAFGFLGIIFLCFTLYAGFLWMTAGGNDENVTKARNLLTQAVIGLAIILLSYSITILVFRIATTEGDSSRDIYRAIWNG